MVEYIIVRNYFMRLFINLFKVFLPLQELREFKWDNLTSEIHIMFIIIEESQLLLSCTQAKSGKECKINKR